MELRKILVYLWHRTNTECTLDHTLFQVTKLSTVFSFDFIFFGQPQLFSWHDVLIQTSACSVTDQKCIQDTAIDV